MSDLTDEHEHEFDDAPVGTVGFCVDFRCREMRVRVEDGWRELTRNEQTEVTLHMMEDLILVDAMSIIHGGEPLAGKRGWFGLARKNGVDKVRYLRGYRPTEVER